MTLQKDKKKKKAKKKAPDVGLVKEISSLTAVEEEIMKDRNNGSNNEDE